MKQTIDVTIIGSGFSGSILAWILASRGLRVALIDAATHPRMAIGESSTPIADAILRRLGQEHQLPELEALSTWGSWQATYPDVACGRKRGFSYFRHRPGDTFCESSRGENSLLVAASASDRLADTHWFRADVDEFFFHRALDAGAVDFSGHGVVAHDRLGPGNYQVVCRGPTGEPVEIVSDWVVDASGRSGVLAQLCGAVELTDQLHTRTYSAFGHFRGVNSWTEYLRQCGVDTSHDPFDADDAAQHHLLECGWLWMLRFNNGITSVGLTAPRPRPLDWAGYRSIQTVMRNATPVACTPAGGIEPRRLQRLYDPVIDPRRIMLPTAAVTIDPLHSTGIAHGLAGVDRIANIILRRDTVERAELIRQYGRVVVEESRFLDRLVATAYATMDDFSRFSAACMLYFAAAIACEERLQRGLQPTHLWSADDARFVQSALWACQRLEDRSSDDLDEIRQRIEPWNTAGLMNPDAEGRYAYTATKS